MKRIIRNNKDKVLASLVGEKVVVEAVVDHRSKDKLDKRVDTMCLKYCLVNNKHVDHIWLRNDINALVDHNRIQGNDKIKFMGLVYSYKRIDGSTGYSVALDRKYRVQLVKAVYDDCVYA